MRMRFPLWLAASCVLVGGSAIFAQEAPGGGRPTGRAPQPAQRGGPGENREPAPSPSAVEPAGPVVTIDFGGGTVGAYVDALRRSSPQPVNVALPPRCAKVAMPPMQLKSVSLADALNAILAVAEIPESEEWAIRPLSRVGGVPWNDPSPDAALGYAVLTKQRQTAAAAVPGQPVVTMGVAFTTEVMSLHDLIASGVKPATVLTAIETAMKMDPGAAHDASVKFHEETSLLIMRGTQEQIHAAQQVIVQLSERASEGKRAEQMEQQQTQAAKIRAQLDELYQVLTRAKMARADAGEQFEEANTLKIGNAEGEQRQKYAAEAREARVKAIEAEVQERRTQAEIDRCEQQLRQIGGLPPAPPAQPTESIPPPEQRTRRSVPQGK
jgi:hypothetical protein